MFKKPGGGRGSLTARGLLQRRVGGGVREREDGALSAWCSRAQRGFLGRFSGGQAVSVVISRPQGAIGQSEAVPRGNTERTGPRPGARVIPIRLFDYRTGSDLPLMHIESNDTLEQRYQFHVVSHRNTLQEVGDGAAGPSEPEGGKPPTAFLACTLSRKQSGVRVGPAGHVRLRGRAAKNLRDLFPPSPTPQLLSSSGVAPDAMIVRAKTTARWTPPGCPLRQATELHPVLVRRPRGRTPRALRVEALCFFQRATLAAEPAR